MGIERDTLAHKIADNIGRTNDNMLIERLKSDIISYRATIIRREHTATGSYAPQLIMDITVPVISVDANTCGAPSGCIVLRTKQKIPKPVRVKREGNNFLYVGSANRRRAFSWIKPEEVTYLKHTRFSSKYPRYTYLNEYIYLFFTDTNKVNIRFVPADPFALEKLKNCDNNTCFVPVFIDEDMESSIKSFIYQELGLVQKVSEETEVKTDERQP